MHSRTRITVTTVFALLAGQAFAGIITVGPSLTEYDYLTITAAVAAANNGDEIVIAPGLYPENVLVNGKDLTLRSAGGGEVILYGQNLGHCLEATNGADLIVRDMTFTAGRSINGGAIAVNAGCSLIMDDCLIEENVATNVGGGVFIQGSAALTNVILRDNSATYAGAAAVAGDADVPTAFTNCLFENNSAFEGGGYGFYKTNSKATLTACIFRGNHAGPLSGAMAVDGQYTVGGTVRVRDCLFDGNSASRGGAIRVRDNNTVHCTNSIFVNNTAEVAGGAISSEELFDAVNCTFASNAVSAAGVADTFESSVASATISLMNCVVVNASATSKLGPGNYYVSYSLLPEAASVTPDANHNINADPLFVDEANADLHLQPGSPAIDAGNSLGTLNTINVVELLLDFDGNDRNVDDPDTSNIGVPAWALNIDMGALEFQPDAAPDCPADLNNDGSLDFFDVQMYLNLYSAGCP